MVVSRILPKYSYFIGILENLKGILELLGKNAVLVQHVVEIHLIFTKRFVIYI